MNVKRSAVLAELREMNGQRFVTREECPIVVTNWRLLVQPLPPKTSAGVIELTKETQEAEEIVTTVAKIIDMGSLSFQARTNAGLCLADEQRKPKIGDFILHVQYAGQGIELLDAQKTKLRIIDDTEVLAVVKDPELIKRYV